MIKKKFFVYLSLTLTLLIPTKVLAYSNSAYSMGVSQFQSQVSKACDTWGYLGYNSYYNIDPTYDYVSSSNRLNSPILFFYAHGTPLEINLDNVKLTNGSSQYGLNISNYSYDNTKLVLLASCQAGQTFPNHFCNKGANCAIGWTGNIYVKDTDVWLDRFYNYLGRGYSIKSSVNYALAYTGYIDSTAQKMMRIVGDTTQILKKENTLAIKDSSFSSFLDNRTNIDKPINNNEESVLNFIIDNNPSFEREDFILDKYILFDTTIYNATYQNNGIESLSGFSVVFEDSKQPYLLNYMPESQNSLDIPDLPRNILESSKALDFKFSGFDTNFQSKIIIKYDMNMRQFIKCTRAVIQQEDGTSVPEEFIEYYPGGN